MKRIKALQKIWSALRQGKETVLIRKGSDVYKYSVEELSEPSHWAPYEGAEQYAVLTALVYVDNIATISEDEFSSDIVSQIFDNWDLVSSDPLTPTEPDKSNRITVSGLKYQCWYCHSRNEYVIVFRGSRFKFGDWWANLRWATRFVPGVDDHYDRVRRDIPALVALAREAYGSNVNIITAGHSLGGGLAQQAAYATNGISRVFTFNTTPVTGYYEVDKSIREENAKSFTITRIFEHGEILAYLRLPLRQLYPLSEKNPVIHELRFNYLKKSGLVSEHSIGEFAKFLFKLAYKSPNKNDIEPAGSPRDSATPA